MGGLGYILFFFQFWGQTVSAQNLKTITGTVKDQSNQPIIGATVTVRFTRVATQTGNMANDGAISNRTYKVKTAQTRAWNPWFYFFPIWLDEMNRN
jgi:hypothetical protein